ncbi:hypothetical protein DFS34DRAFT_160074 [Phlyctochytrium arcticum]|nr:hypothetical protein DFS34DRAFT_160074 [Phlyctochytrium arcticum]
MQSRISPWLRGSQEVNSYPMSRDRVDMAASRGDQSPRGESNDEVRAKANSGVATSYYSDASPRSAWDTATSSGSVRSYRPEDRRASPSKPTQFATAASNLSKRRIDPALSLHDDDAAKGSGNSLLTLLQLRPNVPPTTDLAVVKLSNIAWNLSIPDVIAYFAPSYIPMGHQSPHFTQAVHIIMNRTTGKTQSDCFVEFPSFTDAQLAIDVHSRGILKGRIVNAQWSTQAELMKALFPCRSSEGETHSTIDENRMKSAYALSNQQDAVGNFRERSNPHVDTISLGKSPDGVFLLREEINALLLICRNYKLHYSRKCAERPFENIISIVAKIPWHEPGLIGTTHRDHVFEMLKLSIESLRIHLARHDHQIDETLMARMVRAGLCVPLFTERQKVTLLNVSRMQCPPELASYVYNPPQIQPSRSVEGDDEIDMLARAIEATTVRGGSRLEYEALPSTAHSSLANIDQEFPPIKRNEPELPSTPCARSAERHHLTREPVGSGPNTQYPSPPEAEGSQYSIGTPSPSTSQDVSLPEESSRTPAMTISLYASRVRMLEQALRQSETRYEEFKRRYEKTLTRNQLAQQEVINAKLQTERQCRELEVLVQSLQQRNLELESHCAQLERVIGHDLRQPSAYDLQKTTLASPGGPALSAPCVTSTYATDQYANDGAINSDRVRSIWG